MKLLVEVARSSYGEERDLALEGIKRLGVDTIGTARILLASDTLAIRQAALTLLPPLPNEDALPLLKELLLNEDGDFRAAAVWQLHQRLGREELSEVLRDYVENDRYFYNVATWLDRLVYAPSPLREYYETELRNVVEKRG